MLCDVTHLYIHIANLRRLLSVQLVVRAIRMTPRRCVARERARIMHIQINQSEEREKERMKKGKIKTR